MAVALKTSRPHLMEYLPAIYQEASPTHPRTFLGKFLLTFEKVLVGLEKESRDARSVVIGNVEAETKIEGLGEKIARLHEIFDPGETPEEFLPWLAGWAALSLRSDMSLTRKRRLLANIIPLYRIRGTRQYLEELLLLCVDATVVVSDTELPELQLGIHSTVGSDTYLGGGAPYFFKVTLVAPHLNAPEVEAQCQIARAVIDLGKPAHTDYEFVLVSPALQLGVHSTVGVDTVLGAATT
jgi:phage tail-like protein